MIQDIAPAKLNNSYRNEKPREDDTVLVFDGEGRLLVKSAGGNLEFTTYSEVRDDSAIYLFAVDEKRYFLASFDYVEEHDLADMPQAEREAKGYELFNIRQLRDSGYGSELFAAFTAYHLWKWYSTSRYCGVCGSKLSHDDKERAMRCHKCNNMIFPRINPAVIVGVINGDSILITRYRTGYAHNALVAGFTEIGETLEETVAREVYEEAGIKVRNIRYYKSQPWGMAQDLLAGFYCEVDGDDTIRMDDNELKYAEWTKREDIVLQPNNLSLTNEMMTRFRNGEI